LVIGYWLLVIGYSDCAFSAECLPVKNRVHNNAA